MRVFMEKTQINIRNGHQESSSLNSLISGSADNVHVSDFLDKNAISKEMISYFATYSPDIYSAILDFDMKNGMTGTYLKRYIGDKHHKWHRKFANLLNALDTVAAFPKKYINIETPSGIASVILCGGKGSRMRSSTLHKSCFPINGRPAINRLLDELESVGITEHVVVVGERGRQIVDEIADVRDNVTFVYQLYQNGTGNAAKQAAYLLKNQGFRGHVLVVPGDKVVEKSALERLLLSYRNSCSDMAVMTADIGFWPDAGRIIFDKKGQPVDIVEKQDILRMTVAKKLLDSVAIDQQSPSASVLDIINSEIVTLQKAEVMFPALMEYLEKNETITGNTLRDMVPDEDKYYTCELPHTNEILRYTGSDLDKVSTISNAAIYLYSSDAFYGSLNMISSQNAQQEEYLTDTIKVLSTSKEKDWKVIPVPVKDHYEVMSFNNPKELLTIEEYYTTKESLKEMIPYSCKNLDLNERYKYLRPVNEWITIFDSPGNELHRLMSGIYGGNQSLIEDRRKEYILALSKFMKIYGNNAQVIISRCPGRVNLMGRHVEHRGGNTNYMTIEREAILVAGLRNDDIIDIHNVDSRKYRPRNFSIESELTKLPWDDWLTIIDSGTLRSLLSSSGGDWSNYVKSAALRLQEKYKGRLLFGFNGVFFKQHSSRRRTEFFVRRGSILC